MVEYLEHARRETKMSCHSQVFTAADGFWKGTKIAKIRIAYLKLFSNKLLLLLADFLTLF